ncbi:MAG: DUF2207 domain-containing protein [Microcoleus sp.]
MVTVTHVAAQQLPFYWDNINVTIDLQTNGDMLVTETQKYVFATNYTNQRYRYIPLDKVDEIKDVTVAENNRIIASSTGFENNQLWIRWQHELKPPDSHTFVIKYRVVGGLQVDGENTQVYWKAIWADRKAPIKASQVTVKLPDILAAKVSSFKSFGIPTAVRQVDGQTFVFTTKKALPPKQALEVQVTFPTGIIKLSPPSPQASNDSGFTRDDSSPLGGFLGFTVGAIVLIVTTSPIWIPVILLIKFFSALRKTCPSCKKPTLITTRKLISTPTPSAQGEDKIIRHCKNCGYHHEKIVVMPYLDLSSSSDSSSDGGSSYGDSSSGGGSSYGDSSSGGGSSYGDSSSSYGDSSSGDSGGGGGGGG